MGYPATQGVREGIAWVPRGESSWETAAAHGTVEVAP